MSGSAPAGARARDGAFVATGARRDLGRDAVDVWLTPVDDALAGGGQARCAALLDGTETDARARYVFERDRRLYLAAHALLRTTLTRYTGVPPAAWRFAIEEHGRPRLAWPPAPFDLRFNLSHTDGLCAVAVAREADVGVDVERARDVEDFLAIARTFSSETELRALAARTGDARRDLFFTHWTLKEAYVKARGTGLTIPIHHATLHVDGRTPRIVCEPCLEDDGARWQLMHRRPTADDHLAVAVRRTHGRDRVIRVRWTLAA